MALVKWEPFRDLARMEDRLSRLFREPFFSPVWEEGREGLAEWMPAVDIYEDADRIVVKAELPEMDLKDIQVKIEDGTLRISGEAPCNSIRPSSPMRNRTRHCRRWRDRNCPCINCRATRWWRHSRHTDQD